LTGVISNAAQGSVYEYLDSLPTVTAILSGGDPASCARGGPKSFMNVTPVAATFTFAAVTHTTTSVLTEVGQPVTIAANPFSDDPPPTTTPTANDGTTTQPQSVVVQETTPYATTTFVLQGTTVKVDSSVVVVQGETFTETLTQTQVFVTDSNGSTDLVIGTSTIKIPPQSTATTSSTFSSTSSPLHGPGAAIASGIGLSEGFTCLSYSPIVIQLLTVCLVSTVLVTI
jgi:hypothetical protein